MTDQSAKINNIQVQRNQIMIIENLNLLKKSNKCYNSKNYQRITKEKLFQFPN